MKKIFCILLIVFMWMSSLTVLGQPKVIQVYVNKEQLEFDQSPILYNDRILVPMSDIFERLGANVSWHGDTKTVMATNDSLCVQLRIDDNIMYKNQETITLDTPAMLVGNRTLVPVRAVSETFGADVIWNEKEHAIYISIEIEDKWYINQSGSVEADGNTDTGQNLLNEANENISDPLTLTMDNGLTLTLGDSADTLSRPDRYDNSMYGLEWYVYNRDYSNFVMVAVNDSRICGFYTNSKGFRLSNGLGYGSYPMQTDSLKGIYFSPYYDKHNGDTCYGILAVLSDSMNSYNFFSDEFLAVQAREVFDATNAFRVNYGKEPLLWDESAAIAATRHSQDLADQDYFDHYSLDGRGPWDRYVEVGNATLNGVGENISAGRQFAVDAFDSWVNSKGHHDNMLNDYNYLGVGNGYSSGSTYLHYSTQLFVTY